MSELDPSNERLISEIVKNELQKLRVKSGVVDIQLSVNEIAMVEALARVVYKAPPPAIQVEDGDANAVAALTALLGAKKKGA